MPAAAYERMAEGRPIAGLLMVQQTAPIGPIIDNLLLIWSASEAAEWEFAARSGGKAEKYAGGSDVDAVAWYAANSGDTSHPVGQKAPNGLGIHGMSGNVWEWSQDWYDSDYYQNSPDKNPPGPETGADRVMRGGGWDYGARDCRSAIRSRIAPDDRNRNLGFRLARSVSLGS